MVNPLDLTGKHILVTGASSGIGQATAVLLSQLGAKVICAGRSEAGLAETRSMLVGDEHRFVQFELTQIDEIPKWMKALAAEGGPLSGLVHSAGINPTRPLRILTEKDFSAILTINLEAAAALMKGFRQKGVCDGGGSVVLLSSVAAIKAQPSIAAYAASKGALISLARTLAVELAREKIRVNCVLPALVRTRMTDKFEGAVTPEAFQKVEASYPLGFGTPEDVANAIAFLLSGASRWITGTTLVLDGGYTA
jgi:NAD(P)-dependent dehydrogenase (short-subunit alcohol dehydrogenase family)